LLLCAGVARADGDVHSLAASGQAHFDLGEYPAAITDWRAAYRAEPHAGLLYNLAQAYRLEGDCVTAALLYKNFLRLAPDSPHVADAQANLASVAGCAHDREAAGAKPASDEGSPEALALPESAPLPPPPRAVIEGPAPVPHGRGLRLAGLATGAGGAVLALAGGWFAWDAARAADEVSRGYANGAAWSDLAAADARGQRSALAGAVLIGGGVAAIAAGATLYVLGRRAAIVPARHGAELVLAW
jgi:hypothetical protein